VRFDFSKFIQSVVVPLSYTSGEIEFLRGIRFAAGKYSEFAGILETNPEMKSQFLSGFNEAYKGRLRETVSSASVALSMLGFIPARNFLSSYLVKNKIEPLILENKALNKVIPYAYLGESIGEKFSADYFVAGLAFDLIGAFFRDEKSQALLSVLWEKGRRVAQVACQLSATFLPALKLERELCIDGLTHAIGNLGFTDPLDMQVPNLPSQTFLREVSESGITHDQVGHILLGRLGYLNDTSWVILYQSQPFMAQKLGTVVHVRTLLLWLSRSLIQYREFHDTQKFSDQMVSNWHAATSPILDHCKLDQFKQTIHSVKYD
jgi:hypothetical protein